MTSYSSAGFQVLRQATTPAIGAEGDLWYNTSTAVLYFCDGTQWVRLTDSTNNPNLAMIGELAVQVLYLTADASLTNPDYDEMFGDVLTDSTGFNNTIDTGNTTATFATNAYMNSSSASDTHGVNMTAAGTANTQNGVQIQTNTATNLTRVVKSADCTAPKCKIYADSGSNSPTGSALATANFVGVNADFNLSLSNGTKYYILCDNDGSNYTRDESTSASYPYNRTNVNFLRSWTGSDRTDVVANVMSVETSAAPSNLVVKTNSITLTADATSYMVVSLNNATAGSGSINYDIKFGTTATQTAKQLNTSYTNTSSGNPVITFNLNGTGAGNTSQIGDYVLIVTY